VQTEPPSPLPLSLHAGVRSKRRALYAVGVVVLSTDDAHGPGYLGNWQPTRETTENPKRAGWSWLPVHVIDWSSVR
jgi:hypothetical protein